MKGHWVKLQNYQLFENINRCIIVILINTGVDKTLTLWSPVSIDWKNNISKALVHFLWSFCSLETASKGAAIWDTHYSLFWSLASYSVLHCQAESKGLYTWIKNWSAVKGRFHHRQTTVSTCPWGQHFPKEVELEVWETLCHQRAPHPGFLVVLSFET